MQLSAKAVPKTLIKGPNHGKELLYVHLMHLHFSPEAPLLAALHENIELNGQLVRPEYGFSSVLMKY